MLYMYTICHQRGNITKVEYGAQFGTEALGCFWLPTRVFRDHPDRAASILTKKIKQALDLNEVLLVYCSKPEYWDELKVAKAAGKDQELMY